MTDPTDLEATRALVSRYADEGDEEAFEALYKRYEPLVRWIVRARLKGSERKRLDETDLLQTSFLKVFRGIREHNYREEGQFRAWVVQTVQNKIRDVLRREFAERRDVRREVDLDGGSGHQAGGESPLELANQAEEMLLLQTAMEQLPENLREVILQRDFELKSWPNVAAALGRAQSTAREWYRKAHTRLGELLAEAGPK